MSARWSRQPAQRAISRTFAGLGVTILVATTAANGAQAAVESRSGWTIALRSKCLGVMYCHDECVEVRVQSGTEHPSNILPWWRSRSSYVLEVYRPGYYTQLNGDGTVSATRQKPQAFKHLDDASARISYISGVAQGIICSYAAIEQQKQLTPVFSAIVDEIWKVAELPEQRQSAEHVCMLLYLSNIDPNETPSEGLRDPKARSFFKSVQPKCLAPTNTIDKENFLQAVNAGDVAALDRGTLQKISPTLNSERLNPGLLIAAGKGDVAMLEALLVHGADPNRPNSALAQTVISKTLTPELKVQVADVLLAHGADPNVSAPDGFTPFHLATFDSNAEVVSLMIRHGADVNRGVDCNSCSQQGELPLYMARSAPVAEAILQAGADVNTTRFLGRTALHEVRSAEVASVLIAHGARVDAVTADGWTPLMTCLAQYETVQNLKIGKEYSKIAELLVESGATLSLKNNWGRDALSYTTDEALKSKLAGIANRRR